MKRPFTSGLMRLASLLGLIALFLASSLPAAAQSGADIAANIAGNRHVRIGDSITYTITGTNVGNETATGVQLRGWAPDWFDGGTINCLAGTPDDYGACAYGDVAPGESVSMTITLTAAAGNKRERHMYEQGGATAVNDVNPANDTASIGVIMTGPCRGCPNK